jgi:hypothetical protein
LRRGELGFGALDAQLEPHQRQTHAPPEVAHLRAMQTGLERVAIALRRARAAASNIIVLGFLRGGLSGIERFHACIMRPPQSPSISRNFFE